MQNYQDILLLKLPYCTHPAAHSEDDNFRTKSTFRPVPSLALAALAGFVDRYKTLPYNLKAVDMNIEAYSTPGEPVDTSVYPQLLEQCIREAEYDVLALSAMFVFNVRWVEDAVRLSRQHHPQAKIVLGGGYSTLFPQRCLAQHQIDDAVIGEGDATFLHILNRYNQHSDPAFEARFPFEGYATKAVDGSIEVHDGKRTFLDLADLPAPAWHYLDLDRYFRLSGDRVLPIQGSRGCPYNCTYCSTYIAWGRKLRYKPVDELIAQIEELNRRYDSPALVFTDDNLSFSKEWIVSFLKGLLAKGLKMDATASNFSVKHLDEEVLELLKMAGVKQFGIAVESGSPEMQQKIRKRINFDQARKVIELMKKHDLHAHVCWMVGFPGESLEQVKMTFDLARDLRGHTNQFLAVLPYPGTDLFEEAREAGLLIFNDDDLDKFDYRKSEFLKSDQWTYPQLQEMIYDANIETNFLNSPCLETPQGQEHLAGELEDLVKRLPDHVVAHIVLGHIHQLLGDEAKAGERFSKARDLLQKPYLRATFDRYLSWNYAAVAAFNQYRAQVCP